LILVLISKEKIKMDEQDSMINDMCCILKFTSEVLKQIINKTSDEELAIKLSDQAIEIAEYFLKDKKILH